MIFYAQFTQAQSLGDPIVHITFGSGITNFGPPLAADSGSTTYLYTGSISPDDGQYGIFNTTAGLNAGWVHSLDHTGDLNGYMMIVNASFDPGVFYTRRVDGLCGSATYQFGAWIKNILKGPGILPNVSFSIETLDGEVLGGGNTKDIPADSTWKQYPFIFSTPLNVQSIILKMANNAPGGSGNDLAIDDITFRPYGTPINVIFDQASPIGYCAGSPQTLTIHTTTPLDKNFAQKLQVYQNGAWVDQSAPTTSTTFSFLGPTDGGDYSYRVVKSDAGNINSPQCVIASNNLKISVQAPKASFTGRNTACMSDAVLFADESTSVGTAKFKWHWDFDDGDTSNIESPLHLFKRSGNLNVRLTVTTQYGCVSNIVKAIHIITPVNIDFTAATPYCIGQAVTFTDKSVSTDGSIFTWKWDFGDGKSETRYDNSPFQHTYDTLGVYRVKLTLTNGQGCIDTLVKTVEVHPLPKPNFILPEICLKDASARFIDSSFVADNSPITYLWDFGDDHADVANPNTSTVQNPTHIYSEAKQYSVTLTVTSAGGCQQTLVKPFTVNGSEPKAGFDVLNMASLCSNRDVDFVNQSDVNFGNITRVIWDYGDGSKPDTDENPYKGKLYHHKYAEVNLPAATQSYHVVMLAFSGQSCSSSADNTITTLAVPKLSFNAPDSVCINFGTVQFAAKEGTTISGTGTYSGTGVTPTGLFDPVKAGIGMFDITYIYIATATGCADTLVHKIKVNPIGTVDAGPDVTILSGGTTTLHAIATGDNITYLWSPAVGLSSTTLPNPEVNLDKDMTYTLTVTNSFGCSVSDQVNVKILQAPIVPNTFTPNGDGINDTWLIKYLETYAGASVDVFNRNGQKVYTTINYPVTGWDGRFGGRDLPVGVYYYIIDPKHGRKQISGYVTIVR